MRSTGWLLASGLVACAGAWLVWSGWRQPRPRLTSTIERLEGTDATLTRQPSLRADGTLAALGGLLLGLGAGDLIRSWSQPLRLVRRPVDVHVGLLATATVAGLVAPALLGAIAAAVGMPVGVVVPAGLCVAGAIIAPLVVHADTMRRAAEVHADLRHQLAAYLDMVTMLLAGNSGHEGALEQAARAGDGLLFRELRRRIREVAASGTSLVGALSLVADDFGLVELEQVAATTSLSAAEGAPVARTLSAKCATLRSTLAGEEETAARIRNDKVTPPLVGMALLFMALIIYPALNLH
jgi:Flp pilus assembly protein TadB